LIFCNCNNCATLIELETSIPIRRENYVKLGDLNPTDVSIEYSVVVLLNTTYEELYSKGLLNLAKERDTIEGILGSYR